MEAKEYEALVKRLPEVAEVVNRFKSDSVQQKAFELLLSKLGFEQGETGGRIPRPRARKAAKAPPASLDNNGTGAKGKGRKKSSVPSLVKSLDLRPGGKSPFNDLVLEKQPKSNNEKSLLIVHFLRGFPGVDAVTLDHVFTVYRDQGWRVPANLRNQLQVMASTKGWLDTSEGSDIKVTVKGENYVNHDMPKKKKSS
jgi:hypothetical protein